jgi:hypothetical protein
MPIVAKIKTWDSFTTPILLDIVCSLYLSFHSAVKQTGITC